MAYTQNFASQNGTIYTLNIDNVTVATPPPLAANPIITEEDADTDMFIPVRTQSGYIRMLSMDATTWRNFIPTSATNKPVKLTTNNTVVWQGYLQTGTYGMAFPATYENIELPLVDMLGVLDSFDVDVTGQPEMLTIGELLAYIFGKISGLSLTVYIMTAGVSTVNSWLQYSVIWRNFLNSSGDELEARFSCLGLLEEICKFFGWSCRSMGDGIYLTSITDDHRNTRTLAYTLAQLAAASGGTGASMQTITLTDNDFATTDHSEEYIPGIKQAIVNSELNEYSILSEIPTKEILTANKWNTPYLAIRSNTGVYTNREEWILERDRIIYDNKDVTLSTFIEHTTTDPSDRANQCFGRLVIFDDDADDEEKTKYNWTTAIECFHGVNYGTRVSSTPLFEIESKAAYTISDGVLYINTSQCDLDDYGRIVSISNQNYGICTLRIGTATTGYKYWNGTTWQNSATTFHLEFASEGIKDKDANMPGAEYSGYGIKINQTLYGTIYFAVNDVNYGEIHSILLRFNGYFPLIGFEIGFVRSYEDTDLNDMNYTAAAGVFPDKYEIDTIFSTDKLKVVDNKTTCCQLGYGLLFDGTTVIDKIQYGGTSSMEILKPEQQTADMIAAYGSQVRRVLTVDVWTSTIGALIGPAHRVVVSDQTFYPVAVKHSWWDDLTTLTLMSL